MNKDKNYEEGKKYLMKPHAAQIISILRMFGHGYGNIVPQN
jgi:hypothetical protein